MKTSFSKKYKVIQRLGEGSFSQVLKCQNRITGFFYAAKRLKRLYQSINEIIKSPEIVGMRKISWHPNILYMLEFHHDPLPGKVTLIFEMMDMSLYDMMNNRRGHLMPEHRVKMYLYQLLRGLEHLHKHGIFHRDIKPENILVKANVVKLADLGSIRRIYSRPPYTEYISTRWYRSPECLLTTGLYGPKIDIWALGCVFYELLSLKPLFPGSNEVDQINKIHTVLGPPQAKLIAKFRFHESQKCEYRFPNGGGTGFNNLLPYVTEIGKEFLKLMLVYDPEIRSNVNRLLEHRYLYGFRENDSERQSCRFTLSSTLRDSCQWHNNSVLLPMSSRLPEIMAEMVFNKDSNVDTSSSLYARLNCSMNVCATKIFPSDKGDSKILPTHETRYTRNKSWKSNVYSRRAQRIKDSPTTYANFGTHITYSDKRVCRKTRNIPQLISP